VTSTHYSPRLCRVVDDHGWGRGYGLRSLATPLRATGRSRDHAAYPGTPAAPHRSPARAVDRMGANCRDCAFDAQDRGTQCAYRESSRAVDAGSAGSRQWCRTRHDRSRRGSQKGAADLDAGSDDIRVRGNAARAFAWSARADGTTDGDDPHGPQRANNDSRERASGSCSPGAECTACPGECRSDPGRASRHHTGRSRHYRSSGVG
jgi:hypothetical protein